MQLIVMDLDDTLLRRDKTISPYSMDVLTRCRQAGMLIAFSTARSEFNAGQYIAQVQPDIVISSGGALTRYRGEILRACLFSEDETAALIAAGRERTAGTCEITVDTLYKHYWNYHVDPRIESPDWGDVTYTDYSDFCAQALKVCVELPNPADAAPIADSVEDCEWLRFSGGNWYRFTKKDATKEGALHDLSARLNLSFKDMIAFGDDYGDIGMLRLCGTGIAMGNAISEVQAAADNIAGDCDHDGVAKYLETHFLNI